MGKGDQDPLFKTVVVIGLGLIGSSLTRGMSTRGLAGKVFGYDGLKAVREEAATFEIGAAIVEDLPAAVAQADLVILAVPVGAMALYRTS